MRPESAEEDGSRSLFARLDVRLVALLSIALLPIGLIAVWQTREVAATARENAEISLLSLTEQAVLGERRVLFSALGAAHAIGQTILTIPDDTEGCSRTVRQFVDTSSDYVYGAFIPLSGRIACSTADAVVDVAQWPVFLAQLDNPQIRIEASAEGAISGRPVVTVTRPVYAREEVLAGFVSVSIAYPAYRDAPDGRLARLPEALVTFNADGDILSFEGSMALENLLPANIDLAELNAPSPRVFTGHSADGVEHYYIAVPIVPGAAYTLAVWSTRGLGVVSPGAALPVWLFPLVMWAMSLVVAYIAVQRLVIRHVRLLGSQMRRFARNRRLPPAGGSPGMSQELRSMEEDFHAMAASLLQDEAALANAVHEKNVLLKEVHHRVKNNLQLISSIMSMEIRKTAHRETELRLTRLQRRVQSLASIHRNLYRAENLGRVNAGLLLDELVGQLQVVGSGQGVRIDTQFDDVILYPDQAVPLSLLASEAFTNALKYVGATSNGKAEIGVALALEDGGCAVLKVWNTTGTPASPMSEAAPDDDEAVPGGLGSQLIAAFARQLDGTVSISEADEHHVLSVRFAVTDFEEAPPET
ncbi:MAG: sensor histidine kinase [Rubricella sp.]